MHVPRQRLGHVHAGSKRMHQTRGMSKFGKFLQVQVGMKPNLRTQHNHNTNNQQLISAAKENVTVSTATTATTATMMMIASHKMKNKPTREEKAKTEGPLTFEEIVEGKFGLPYHEVLFMTEKEPRHRGDRTSRPLDAYIHEVKNTD